MPSRRWINKKYVDALKSAPCTDCGKPFPTDAMDFDHVNGVKLANISDLLDAPRAVLDAELAKTELVCANCHRIREMNRRLDLHVEAADAFDVDALLLEDGAAEDG